MLASGADCICTAEGYPSTKSSRIIQLQKLAQHDKRTPEPYTTSSETEMKWDKQVEEFRSNFVKEYPGLKERASFLMPLNEYGTKKIACSTIKPTLAPHPELYDLRKCVECIARFVDYEPLDHKASELTVVSPSQTISWAIGDAFDLSVLMASLLIGAGYDAYVVLGKAPRSIRIKDQSHQHCTVSDKENENDPTTAWSVEFSINDEYRSNGGESTGMHCWLLVRPGSKRELSGGPCFVEPSTGMVYSVEKNMPYEEIWCAWNDKNYWVNTSTQSMGGIENFEEWSQVFQNNVTFSSWVVDKINVPMGKFGCRYPRTGQKCFLLEKSKLEYFDEDIDPQGLAARFTQCEDEFRTIVVSCTELFYPNRRSDHLIQRTRRPMEMSYADLYSIENAHSIKERSESPTRRSIKFHIKTRADSLIDRVEEIGASITENFHNRSDSLIRRVVYLERFAPADTNKPKNSEIFSFGTGLGVGIITQIDEDFEEPNNKAEMRHSVAKRSYRLRQKIIILTYHCRHEALQHQDLYTKEELTNTESGNELLRLEASSILEVKKIQNEMVELRQWEYRFDIKLSSSVTVGVDNDDIITNVTSAKEDVRVEENTFDYLSPFLALIDSDGKLTRAEAKVVRESCLRAMKERSIERANIMQCRLDRAREELSRKQDCYERIQIEGKFVENQVFDRQVADESFRLKIVERRLSEHKESSIIKYKALQKKLDGDERLTALQREDVTE